MMLATGETVPALVVLERRVLTECGAVVATLLNMVYDRLPQEK
jgi:hypothetical protein